MSPEIVTSPLRLLFVEDCEDDFVLVLRELKQEWEDIESKRVDTREGLKEMLASKTWDVVISDHAMPGFSSEGALEVLQELGLDIPFIVVSGVVREEIVTETMRNGAHDFISKSNLVRLAPAIQRELKEATLRKERCKIQVQLEASERRHASLFHANPAPMLLIDAGSLLIEDANPAAAKFFGFPVTSLRQVGLRAIIGRQAWTICKTIKQQTSKNSYRFSEQVRISDGSLRDVEIFACVLRQGPKTHFYATIFDETERHNAEINQARLVAAVEQITEALAITDAKGVVCYANSAFEKLTGQRMEDIEGHTLDLTCSDALPERIVETAIQGDPWEGRVSIRTLQGKHVETNVTISPVKDAEGHVHDMVIVLRDVTREIETEKQLRQVEKMDALGALAAGITHDFNNVLTAILSATELIKWNLPEKSPLLTKVDAILQAGLFASGLTKQILAFSRRTEERGIPLDLSVITRNSLNMLRSTLPNNIEQHYEISSGIWVTADPSQLHQVIINLVLNAFHAMEHSGGLLEVSLSEVLMRPDAVDVPAGLEEGRYAKLTIRDTGCGMDAQTLERIFEPFFTTKAAGEGTGLGLSVVHATISKLGGTIQVNSELGRGTTFQVFLPCSSGVQATIDDELPQDVGGSEHILFVDDEDILTALAKQGLQNLGYQVSTRTSAREALELFQSNPKYFDLVFTDLMMADMNGSELANRMLEIRPDMPIIMVSGLPASSALAMNVHAAFKGIVTKPFTPFDLAKNARIVLVKAQKSESYPITSPDSSRESDDAHRKQSHSILVAEDSHVTRGLIRKWLERSGYKVIEAKDGQNAWELYAEMNTQAPISLLLTDVEMPRMDGLELAKRMRKADPSIPIAIFTSNQDQASIKTALQLGVNDYLNKPFEAQELIGCVEKLLAERSSRVEARRSAETAQAVRLAQRAMVAVPEKDLSLYSLYEPLTDAGGDVFRGLRCSSNSVFFVLADVAGHSVISSYAVAAFLAMLSTHVSECHGLRPIVHSHHDESEHDSTAFACAMSGNVPCDPLRHLAMKLNHDIQEGPFSEVPVCVLLGLWTPETGRLHLLNAGIPHGLVCRREEGATYPIEINGVPLGVLPKPMVEERVIYLQPGDRMLLGTDGFFDVLSPSKVIFNDTAPEQWNALKETPIDWALSIICEVARNHGEGVIADDLLVIGFEQPLPAAKHDELRLRIPSTARLIDLACKQLTDFLGDPAKGLTLSSERRFDIVLALREALTNAVYHGNQERPDTFVDLYCRIDEQASKLVISVTDEGQGFELGPPTITVDPLSERGRGLPLIRNFAQSLKVVGSELTMEFNLKENCDGEYQNHNARQEVG